MKASAQITYFGQTGFYKNLLVLFYLLLNSPLFSQVAAPTLECIDVASNGDVSLTWNPATDGSGTFVEYRVYADEGTGFGFVGTESNINATSFLHAGALADGQSVDYYVTSFSSVESSPSDTLSSIFLRVIDPNNGTALLQWNAMHDPALSTSYSKYYIYREYPIGNWSLYDSVPLSTLLYSDTITFCDDTVTYRIELNSTTGCVSGSNLDGGVFQNLIAPLPPNITSVSVDTASGDAVINWNVSPSTDVIAYLILQNNNGSWQVIDTVHGYNNTSYTNALSSSGIQSETYAVAAYDSCFSGNPPSPNTGPFGTDHSTIKLSAVLAVCDKEVTLNWNPYVNWRNGVAYYEVYADFSGGGEVLIGTVSNDITTFIHENVSDGITICYTVKAHDGNGNSSLSNKECIYIYQPPVPAYSYLQSATVVAENEIEVRYHSDENSPISQFSLERTDDLSEPYEFVETAFAGTNPIIFTDMDVETNLKNYYYRITLEDSCGRDAMPSNIAKTVLLKVTANSTTMTNLLQWSAYEKWDGELLGYNIYRSVNGQYSNVPVDFVPANTNYYEDDVEQFIGSDADGAFCYYIEAIEGINSYGLAETSVSNEQCAFQEAIVYAPNGLFLDGINNQWKPVVNLLNFSSYQVKVIGRKGHLVFESEDPNQYWDGTYKGTFVPIGVYVYQITFFDGENKYHVKSGHITVVR